LVLAAAWRWLDPADVPSLRTLLAEREAAEQVESERQQPAAPVPEQPMPEQQPPAAPEQPAAERRPMPVAVDEAVEHADPEGPNTLAG
jgi:hypothetical protein